MEREPVARTIYRWLTAIFMLAVVVQFVAALAGRVGWRLSLVLLVACVVQLPLAHVSGWAGGLHPVVGLVIVAIGSLLAHRAFAGARRAARAT